MNGLIARDDGHPALISPGELTMSYGQLLRAIERLARQLARAGIEANDRVVLTMSNGPEFVAAFLAVLCRGATAAPLNPRYTEPEYQTYLSDIDPKALIYLGDKIDAAHGPSEELGLHELYLERGDGDALRLRGLAPAKGAGPYDGDHVALLLHTSGTTGKPKGVPLGRSNILASAETIAATYGLTGEDVSHCVMPLFHVHGLIASTLATLQSGGTVLVPPRFSASVFWPDSLHYGATWFSAVPTIHQILLSRTDEAEGKHQLRFARSCSAALPSSLQQEVEERLRVPLLQAYGMSEAAHQIASNPLPPGERRGGSVGLETGAEIAVVDDDWRQLEPESQGEVVIRGPSVIKGYRDNPQANAEAFRDGWFRTGDSGRLSADGYLTLEGRIKELINRGGEKISPHEVEEALLAHPAVSESVVYGVSDDTYGERVAAAIVAVDEADLDDLEDHCTARLADFKVPTEIRVVSEIPKGPTGKIQRRLMPELLGG
jgi:acyl-CoA synthetase (AMP-forming)/AMP-acid ligase II